jgi:hypothetical protein
MSSFFNFVSTLLVSSLFLFSCASRLPTPAGVPDVSVSAYEGMVVDRTKKVEVYDGLYNKLTIQATWLDSQLTDAALSHSARLAQWNEQKYKEEREKKVTKNAESTTFFISIYTPERKSSDLASSRNLWKIFLDVGGQRFEGKATKVKQTLTEIQVMYPHYNRWSTPYTVSFPVANSLVENKPATLIFTGAVGSAQLDFNKVPDTQ